MGIEKRLVASGHAGYSNVVLLPKEFCNSLKLKAGDTVLVSLKDRSIRITKKKGRKK